MKPGALHYVRRGGGEPLVLIHPLGAAMVVWEPVLGRLARTRRDRLDLPGFGASPALWTEPSRPAEAGGRGRRVARRGRRRRAHVVGNSLGAWVAIELAKGGRARSVTGITAGFWSRPIGPRRGLDAASAGADAPVLPTLCEARAGAGWRYGARWLARSGCRPRRRRGWCART